MGDGQRRSAKAGGAPSSTQQDFASLNVRRARRESSIGVFQDGRLARAALAAERPLLTPGPGKVRIRVLAYGNDRRPAFLSHGRACPTHGPSRSATISRTCFFFGEAALTRTTSPPRSAARQGLVLYWSSRHDRSAQYGQGCAARRHARHCQRNGGHGGRHVLGSALGGSVARAHERTNSAKFRNH